MRFERRGIVLVPSDLSLAEWPELAARAGLNTIALHPTPDPVIDFVRSTDGQAALARVAELGLDIEYELHAMAHLLPRALFPDHPHLFRMNEAGERVPDANLCQSSEEGLERVAEHAEAVSRILRPTTHRYFLWPDDGAPWCQCPLCRDLTPSDQSTVVANRIAAALRQDDADARVAWLAYANTMAPPRNVRPAPELVLEWAPIERDSGRPLDDPGCEQNARLLAALDKLLEVFPADTAQVLEYWMDASRFCGWRRPAVRIPFDAQVLRADLAALAARGITSATSFGVWLDADYVRMHGMFPIDEYGAALSAEYPGPPAGRTP
jgi:hypothetical protein